MKACFCFCILSIQLAEPLCNCNVESPFVFSSALFVVGSPSLEVLEGTTGKHLDIYIYSVAPAKYKLVYKHHQLQLYPP